MSLRLVAWRAGVGQRSGVGTGGAALRAEPPHRRRRRGGRRSRPPNIRDHGSSTGNGSSESAPSTTRSCAATPDRLGRCIRSSSSARISSSGRRSPPTSSTSCRMRRPRSATGSSEVGGDTRAASSSAVVVERARASARGPDPGLSNLTTTTRPPHEHVIRHEKSVREPWRGQCPKRPEQAAERVRLSHVPVAPCGPGPCRVDGLRRSPIPLTDESVGPVLRERRRAAPAQGTRRRQPAAPQRAGSGAAGVDRAGCFGSVRSATPSRSSPYQRGCRCR